jgi:nicotinamidase/pyrazinamidase
LDQWLKSKQVTGVYVCGLATDYCVKFTALDAAQLGFKVTLIEDACRGVELRAGDTQRALDGLKRAGVAVIERAALCN